MKKRGSLDLSINAIVILILAITMLGLGLAFMSGVFGSATEEFQEISGVIQKQIIDQMKQTDKVVELENPVKKIGVGEKKTTYIGFKNNQNEVINFIIKGIRVSSIPGAIIDCGLYEEDVILEYKHKATSVQPGTVAVLPMNIKTDSRSEKGTCFYEILIDEEDDSLVGYWNFNKEDDATDISGNGNDGTLKGGIENSPWVDDELGGRTYEFDGVDDSVLISTSGVHTTPGSKNTVSFWMKWSGANSKMPFSWNTAYDLYLITSALSFNTGNGDWLGTSSSGLANNLVHVAAVFYNGVPDATNNEIYIDGIKKELDKDYVPHQRTRGNKAATSTAYISGWGTTGYKFPGTIDDVKIYNKALSESEVKQLANGYDYSIQLTVNVK